MSEYRPVEYVIPANVDDDGLIFELIKKQNLKELVPFVLVSGFLWWVFTAPFGIVVKVMSALFLLLPSACLIAFFPGNWSFGEWVVKYISFQYRKRVMQIRVPRNETKTQAKDKKVEKKEKLKNSKLKKRGKKAGNKKSKKQSPRREKKTFA